MELKRKPRSLNPNPEPEPKAVKCYRIRTETTSKGKVNVYIFRPDSENLRSESKMQVYCNKSKTIYDKILVSFSYKSKILSDYPNFRLP